MTKQIDTRIVEIPKEQGDNPSYIENKLYEEYSPDEINWMELGISQTCSTCKHQYTIRCSIGNTLNIHGKFNKYTSTLTCQEWKRR